MSPVLTFAEAYDCLSAGLTTLKGATRTGLVTAPLRIHWVQTRIRLCVPLGVAIRTRCRFGRKRRR